MFYVLGLWCYLVDFLYGFPLSFSVLYVSSKGSQTTATKHWPIRQNRLTLEQYYIKTSISYYGYYKNWNTFLRNNNNLKITMPCRSLHTSFQNFLFDRYIEFQNYCSPIFWYIKYSAKILLTNTLKSKLMEKSIHIL